MIKKFFGSYIVYSKYIFKFWVTQVAMGAFGIIISMSAIALQNNVFTICASLLCVSFICFLMYDFMFDYGFKESVIRTSEGQKKNLWKGLKISLLSVLPTALIILFAFICNIINFEIGSKIFVTILYIIQGIYTSTVLVLGDSINLLALYAILLLPSVISCTLAYYIGASGKTLRQILGLKVKPTKEK